MRIPMQVVATMLRAFLDVLALAAASAAPALETLEPEALNEYAAPLARQGVAVGQNAFFAIAGTGIARHARRGGRELARRGGRELARWQSVGREGVAHLSSCTVTREGELLCANSNFPALPMAASLEWFDTATLRPALAVAGPHRRLAGLG